MKMVSKLFEMSYGRQKQVNGQLGT
uniref:Uncharacterized protein n=1 Tax=Arundo donax TaxID=35708 RepID=A0A0A9FGV6_ARUDO